jgi:formate/nitrite transporter FocA (FNT family)
MSLTPAVSGETLGQMLAISREAIDHGRVEILLHAVTAGYLMASMVWLMPAAGAAQFHVVALMTYLIGAGGFAHVVAGSVEAFLLLLQGEHSALHLLGHFWLPALGGNILGGTVLFAVIAHAQVMQEMDPP